MSPLPYPLGLGYRPGDGRHAARRLAAETEPPEAAADRKDSGNGGDDADDGARPSARAAGGWSIEAGTRRFAR
jgi:hypothetical protein